MINFFSALSTSDYEDLRVRVHLTDVNSQQSRFP